MDLQTKIRYDILDIRGHVNYFVEACPAINIVLSLSLSLSLLF